MTCCFFLLLSTDEKYTPHEPLSRYTESTERISIAEMVKILIKDHFYFFSIIFVVSVEHCMPRYLFLFIRLNQEKD